MNEAKDANGLDAEPRGRPRQRSLGEHGREIQHDVQTLSAAVQDAADDLQRYVTTQVEQRPYITLGVAAGVGFVLGGGLRPRLAAVLLGTATRVAMAVAARELAARLSPPDASVLAHNKSS